MLESVVAVLIYRGSKGTQHMSMILITMNPAAQSAILNASCSASAEAKRAARNGMTANIEIYGTPTFLPHALHVAGTAGPRHILRRIEIPGLPQWGQFSLRIVWPRCATNDPSSATRPARGYGCNRNAMDGFAAAHGCRLKYSDREAHDQESPQASE